MNDYVKLKSILRVDDYALSLVHYPWLPRLRPFLGWDPAHPSRSLSWFEAYNSLKHDKQQPPLYLDPLNTDVLRKQPIRPFIEQDEWRIVIFTEGYLNDDPHAPLQIQVDPSHFYPYSH
jgi:hypothetical protein